MKQVTFKVATALKDAGYPQDLSTYQKCYWSHCDDIRLFNYDEVDCLDYWQLRCVAPTYLEVWLWLWREKKACIGILFDDGDCTVEIRANKSFLRDFDSRFDPEEAIKSAIEFLVDNDLIK